MRALIENGMSVARLNLSHGGLETHAAAIEQVRSLSKQLGISAPQLSYITHSNSGEGLLFFGGTIIPFVDRFPADTEIYRLLTTRPEDINNEAANE